MEIKTCEEYVINELERAQNELSLVSKENEENKQVVGSLKICDNHIKACGLDMSLAEVLYKAKNIDVINECYPNKDQHIVIDITMRKEIK